MRSASSAIDACAAFAVRWTYFMVVEMSRWPANTWTSGIGHTSTAHEQYEWRRSWKTIGFCGSPCLSTSARR